MIMRCDEPLHPGGNLLRLITAGSVDDGKSTLIGRILIESKAVTIDQLQAAAGARHSRTIASDAQIDLALLTDGLESEREQGITIDVAYRYFRRGSTRFVLADAPGHEQYTRNLVTGATQADLGLVIIDAGKVFATENKIGLLKQTRRHTALLNLIKVPQLAFVINKMDQLNFDPKAFHLLEALVVELCDELQIKPAGCIPVSALTGEGVSSSGPNLSWYKGPCLLDFLGQSAHKQAHFNRVDEQAPLVFSIQAVARDQGETRDPIRAYLGWAAQGQLRKGDWLIDFASRQEARVLDLFPARLAELDGARTDQHDEQHKRQEDEQTVVGEPLALILDKELDLGRGDTLLGAKVLLEEGLMQAFHAKFCWLDDEALNLQRRYEIQHGTKRLKARIVIVDKVLNINTMYFEPCDGVITANTIGVMQIELQAPIFALPYEISRELGSFALIHEHDQSTAAAGMILKRGDSGGV